MARRTWIGLTVVLAATGGAMGYLLTKANRSSDVAPDGWRREEDNGNEETDEATAS